MKLGPENRKLINNMSQRVSNKLGNESILTRVIEAAAVSPPHQPHLTQKNKATFEGHVANLA
jgi:hypothetical protein